MKQTRLQRFLSFALCLVLIAAMALLTVGCDGEKKSFTFIVVEADGKETAFEITTRKSTVGDALQEEKLIKGESQAAGFMVTHVNGIRADWNLDGAYWAFYIGDEYAMSGVDTTKIEDGAIYKFVYTKA